MFTVNVAKAYAIILDWLPLMFYFVLDYAYYPIVLQVCYVIGMITKPCLCPSVGSSCIPKSHWVPHTSHGQCIGELLHQRSDVDSYPRVSESRWRNEKNRAKGWQQQFELFSNCNSLFLGGEAVLCYWWCWGWLHQTRNFAWLFPAFLEPPYGTGPTQLQAGTNLLYFKAAFILLLMQSVIIIHWEIWPSGNW